MLNQARVIKSMTSKWYTVITNVRGCGRSLRGRRCRKFASLQFNSKREVNVRNTEVCALDISNRRGPTEAAAAT